VSTHRRAIGVAAFAAAFLLATAAALATNSNISITSHDHAGQNGHFTGKVSSSDPVCERQVKVKLYRDKLGGGSHFKRAGGDITNKHGNWRIDFKGRIPKGTYYATSGGGDCPLAKTTRVRIAQH
jgi:hypothetical protein